MVKGIQKLIGKGKETGGSEVKFKPRKKDKVKLSIEAKQLDRARYINRSFTSLLSSFTGAKRKPFGLLTREFRIFLRLAEELRDDIDVVDWIAAHIRVYGRFTYAARLIAESSHQIYSDYVTLKYSRERKSKSDDDLQQLEEEMRLLEEMSKRWGVSHERIYETMQGLFPSLTRAKENYEKADVSPGGRLPKKTASPTF